MNIKRVTAFALIPAAPFIGIILGAAIIRFDHPQHQSPTTKIDISALKAMHNPVKYAYASPPLVPCSTDYECMVLNGGDGGPYGDMDDYYDLCGRVMSCTPRREGWSQ